MVDPLWQLHPFDAGEFHFSTGVPGVADYHRLAKRRQLQDFLKAHLGHQAFDGAHILRLEMSRPLRRLVN